MKTKSEIGSIVGRIGIALSALCFVVAPVFTPAIALAALVGTFCGIVALVLGVWRVALVAITVAVMPYLGALLLQYTYARAMSTYVVFAPMIAVAVIAAMAVIDHSRRKRAHLRVA